MMGKKLTPDQLALYKRIDVILWKEWDPCGVSDAPEARDEYHSYLPQVFGLVMRGCDAKEIAGYLRTVEVERMGLSKYKDNCKEVAEKVLSEKVSLGL